MTKAEIVARMAEEAKISKNVCLGRLQFLRGGGS